MWLKMPRKPRKNSVPPGENDAEKKKSTEKTHEERDDQGPSSSSNIQKPGPGITKRKTRGSSAEVVSQDASSKKGSTDVKLLAMLKKPGIQEILARFRESGSSTSPLSAFKIPKKKRDSSARNEDTVSQVLEVGKGKATSSPKIPVKQSLPKIIAQDEKKACKRKAEAIGDTDQTTESPKRRSSGVGVGVSKGKANIQEPVQNQSTNRNVYETSTSALRPAIKAKRSLPPSLPLPSDPSPVTPPARASTSIFDTPEMKQVKAKITAKATVDNQQMKQWKAKLASRKKKEVQKCLSTPPTVHIPQLISSPSRSNNSVDKSYPQRPSESVNNRFFETHAIHTYNPISEIRHISRNEENDAYVQSDTTDAMDVDIIQTASTSNTTVKKLFIIIDTNVWIGNQLLIQELLDVHFQTSTGSMKAIVIIPWTVLQEIDHNKKDKDTKKAFEFREAAKFINSLLSDHHPQVKGEIPTHAAIRNQVEELVNDDSILNCAIKHSKLTQVKAVLLTNDINLLNKALVYGLAAFKANDELISNLRRCLSDENDNHSQTICDLEESGNTYANQSQSVPLSNSLIASPYYAVNSSFTSNSSAQGQGSVCSPVGYIAMDVDDPMGMDESEFHPSEIITSTNEEIGTNPAPNQVFSSLPSDHPTFEAVATAVQQSLTSVIVPVMVKHYGDDDDEDGHEDCNRDPKRGPQLSWKEAIKFKPPFTFESAVKCIQAHWIAVFSYVFPERRKNVVDVLVNTFRKKPTSSEELKTWRLAISELALALLTNVENVSNQPRVAECCRLLQAYIELEQNNSA